MGNNNALEALVSNAPGPTVIAAVTQLFWFRIAELNLAVWFERVPPKKNIADRPTKLIPAQCTSLDAKTIRRLPRPPQLITAAELAMAEGRPLDPTH